MELFPLQTRSEFIQDDLELLKTNNAISINITHRKNLGGLDVASLEDLGELDEGFLLKCAGSRSVAFVGDVVGG